MLIFICTFLPSTIMVFFCKLGFQTFLVRRKEKLTLWPYCLPLPVSSHFCMILPFESVVNCTPNRDKSQSRRITGGVLAWMHPISATVPVTEQARESAGEWLLRTGATAVVYYSRVATPTRRNQARTGVVYLPTSSCASIRYTLNMNFEGLLLFIPLLLVAMTIHEASHALIGYWLGDHTAKSEGRLSLNPLVHIDPIFTVLIPGVLILLGQPPILAAKPVPFNPYNVKFGEFGAALIALAGPVSNILLAIVSAFIIRFTTQDVAIAVLEFFVMLNVSLAIFNLIPWPPLDGSRVLYAFAPEPVQRVMRQIEGMGIAGLFIFIFIAWGAIGPVVVNIQSWLLDKLV